MIGGNWYPTKKQKQSTAYVSAAKSYSCPFQLPNYPRHIILKNLRLNATQSLTLPSRGRLVM